MRCTRALALLCAIALLLTGCFGGGRVRTEITKYDGCAAPVSARFYFRGADGGKTVEELSPERLPELIEALDALQYTTHSFHTDYFWGGQYGVELTLADGTFWNYDGTRVEHRRVSITEADENQNRIAGTFTELVDCDFWDSIRPFFDSVSKIMP